MYFFKNIFSVELSPKRPKDLLTSQWQKGDTSLIYLFYRWIIAAFFAFALGFSIYTNIQRHHFRTYFIYLTHQNFCASVVMTFFGAFLVTLHHFDKLRLEKEIPRTLKLYWLLWNQSIVFATAISIFYWCIPHDDAEINLNNILIHVLNSTVLIFDLFIVNHPANFPSFIYFLPVEFAYLLFTIAYQFLGGVDKFGANYVYSRADWKNKPKSATLFFLLFLVFSIFLHTVFDAVHLIRRYLHKRLSKKMICGKRKASALSVLAA